METISKVKLSGIFYKESPKNEFKVRYQPGEHLINEQKSDMLSDFIVLQIFGNIILVKY